jgi:glycine betaine/proline transport system ATP-binding protein
MQDELIKLQEKMHKTIIFISHDLDEALKLGDRIILMKDGYIVQEGTAESILTSPPTSTLPSSCRTWTSPRWSPRIPS